MTRIRVFPVHVSPQREINVWVADMQDWKLRGTTWEEIRAWGQIQTPHDKVGLYSRDEADFQHFQQTLPHIRLVLITLFNRCLFLFLFPSWYPWCHTLWYFDSSFFVCPVCIRSLKSLMLEWVEQKKKSLYTKHFALNYSFSLLHSYHWFKMWGAKTYSRSLKVWLYTSLAVGLNSTRGQRQSQITIKLLIHPKLSRDAAVACYTKRRMKRWDIKSACALMSSQTVNTEQLHLTSSKHKINPRSEKHITQQDDWAHDKSKLHSLISTTFNLCI